jgi:hypothetical protein
VSRPAKPRVPARSPPQAVSIGGENRAAGHGWVPAIGDGGTVVELASPRPEKPKG